MRLSIENLDRMNPVQEQKFWDKFTARLANGDGRAANGHLAAGFPIYFREAETPEGLVIKQHPGGRREWVTFDDSGERIIPSVE